MLTESPRFLSCLPGERNIASDRGRIGIRCRSCGSLLESERYGDWLLSGQLIDNDFYNLLYSGNHISI